MPDTPLTRQKIEEALKVCDAATPGKWSAGEELGKAFNSTEVVRQVFSEEEREVCYRDKWWATVIPECEPEDAAFVALARTEFPRALRALRDAMEDSERLECLLQQISTLSLLPKERRTMAEDRIVAVAAMKRLEGETKGGIND